MDAIEKLCFKLLFDLKSSISKKKIRQKFKVKKTLGCLHLLKINISIQQG